MPTAAPRPALTPQQLRRLIQVQRLSRLAHNTANEDFIRDACRSIGLGHGDAVVEVGCGPLGGLAVLAELIGPDGRVVGIDHNSDVLELAGQTVRRGGLRQVVLQHGDVNDPACLRLLGTASFDAVYCRLVLVNQRDPVETLRNMASLVRPGGHVIAHELLFDPSYPVFEPPVPAFNRVLELMRACMTIQGKLFDVAHRFDAIAGEAGLIPVRQRGLFDATPSGAPEFIQQQGVGLLMVFRESFINLGLASQEEIVDLLRQLKEASARSYDTFFSWMFIELIARVPGAAPTEA